ncbi:MAG: hypothetical protein AB8H80_07790 [Planctomycetota bacterium]
MLALLQQAERQAEPLTTGGWIMMTLSIVAVTTLVIYCYKRILTQPDPKDMDVPGGFGP